MTAISLHGLSKAYTPQHLVLHPLDLQIRSGEFLALLGPSGCGKTTLLRLLAGFEQPSTGAILFDGLRVADARSSLPPEQRSVGMVFQSFALWPHLSVAENIAYPLRAQGVSSAQRREVVMQALQQMDLHDLGERRPDQLSGGQRQRVALARCLVQQPRLALLDEPLASLDVHLREQMVEAIRDFHQVFAGTLVYVTHDQQEAMALADRIAVLQDGRLQQIGTPQELHDTPRSAFVAEFLGRGRLLPVDGVERAAHEAHARVGGLRVPLLGPVLHADDSLRMLLRPDAVRLCDGEANARVTRVRYRGGNYEIEAELTASVGARVLFDVGRSLSTGESVCIEAQRGWLV